MAECHGALFCGKSGWPFWIVHGRFVTHHVCRDRFGKQDDRVGPVRLRGPEHGIWIHLCKTIISTELDIQLRSSYGLMVVACQVSRARN